MSEEETTSPSKAPRPLPSVDMPLLATDVRAAQRRRIALIALLLGAIAASAAALFYWPHSSDAPPDANTQSMTVPLPGGAIPTTLDDAAAQAQEPAAANNEATAQLPTQLQPTTEPSTPVPPTPPEPSAPTKTERTFGRAGSFREALTSNGASGREADELIAALDRDRVLDFRRCRPEDKLTFERDETGALSRFTYRSERTHYVQVTRDRRGALKGERVAVPIEHVRRAVGGVVTGSLGDALERVGLGRNLAGLFVETFEGKIAFNTQTRTGDSFRVILDEDRIDGTFLRWGNIYAIEYTGARAGRHRAYGYTPHSGLNDFYDANGRTMHGGWLRTPLRYDHISSPFNPRRMHPVLRKIMPHNGIDYSAGTGTPVWAAADGTVTWAGDKGPNGNLVSLRHAGGYESHYAHLSRIATGIRPGVTVQQRQVIGYVGTTGRSTGPHLHFGMRRNGRFIDPAREMNGAGRPLPSGEMNGFQRTRRQMDAELDRIDLPEAPAPPAPSTRSVDEVLEEEEEAQ